MSLLTPTTASVVFRITARPAMIRQTLSRNLPLCQAKAISTLRPFAANTPIAQSTPAAAKGASRILCQSRFASSTAQAAAGAEAPAQLDWNTFFQLRKTRRRIQVLFSIAGAATCGTAGSWMLATGIAEPLLSLIPLDPFITMGLMAFSSATLGWLLGPSLGAGVFNMWHRRIKPQMASVRCHVYAFRV